MIKANELRIGNQISERDNHRIYEVKNILLNRVVVQYWSCGEVKEIHFSKLIPIPLTPEILEKCGFEKHKPYSDNDYDVVFDKENGLYLTFSWRNRDEGYTPQIINSEDRLQSFGINIKYLHQLQNLYFVLTSRELKININVETV